MAITVPSSYDQITLDEIKGRLSADAGAEILERLLLNTNYLYAAARWPFLSASCYGAAVANPGTATYYSRIPTPSADSLSYEVRLCWWQSSAAATITVDVDTSTTGTTGSWTAGITATRAAGTTDVQWLHSSTLSLTSSMNALRFELSASVGSVQLQHVLVTPAALGAISSGTKTSGFIGYDPALLNATAGAPVNTEMVNRVRANAANILNDRRRCCLGFMWEASQTSNIRKQLGVVTNMACVAPASLPGMTGETVTVWARASTSAGTSHIIVGSAGGSTGLIDLDNTDNSDTFVVNNERQDFYISWHHNAAGATIAPTFVMIEHDWVESTDFLDLSANVTPPALLSYLVTLNRYVETVAVCAAPRVNGVRGWPVPAHPVHAGQAGGTDWYWWLAVGPGNHSMRGLWGRCEDLANTGTGAAQFLYAYSTSHGATANDQILVPLQAEGLGTNPFADGGLRRHYVVESSTFYEDPSTSAQDMLYAIAPGTMDVHFEEVWGQRYQAYSGQLRVSKPLA